MNKIRGAEILSLVKKGLIPIYLLVLLFTLYHVYYAKKVIPGVYAGGVSLGGKSRDEAQRLLSEKHSTLDTSLILTHEDTNFEISADSVDLQYSIEGTAAKAFEVGRTGNVAIDTKDKIAGLIKPLRIKAVYTLNADALTNTLATIKGELNALPEDAGYVLEEDVLKIVPERSGTEVDSKKLYTTVVTSFDQMDFAQKDLTVNEVPADVAQDDIKEFEPEIRNILSQNITITSGANNWTLDSEKLLPFIKVAKNGRRDFDLKLNDAVVEAYAELISQDVNIAPRGRVTESAEGRVASFTITQEGKELDAAKFKEDVKSAVFGEDKNIELAMVTVSEADPKKYGIYALLGSGTSKYTGSASPRVYNLTLAAKRTDGVLVPPGATYSFNRAVGDISAATGYQTAYVISNGRTVLGDGGGVCQTSTTLFRAILNSGLPIVARNPHAYRVVYYEIDSPLGMDASIYQPSLDFQFKNDTVNYVLIQMFANEEEQLLGFKIYGTPDGRETEITKPLVTNVSGPPEPLYVDDPTLDKGVVKQVDFAAGGATASFSRTVTREGEVLHQDTFTTRYQPWRAIFLKGTKEK